MFEVKVVGRSVDTLVLNVCYLNDLDKPIKQELNADLQADLSRLQEEAGIPEVAVMTPWAFTSTCSRRDRVGSGAGS